MAKGMAQVLLARYIVAKDIVTSLIGLVQCGE